MVSIAAPHLPQPRSLPRSFFKDSVMKTLLLVGAMLLAAITGVVRDPAGLAQPDAPWARIVHTVR
jgi:hypothetical protein